MSNIVEYDLVEYRKKKKIKGDKINGKNNN